MADEDGDLFRKTKPTGLTLTPELRDEIRTQA